MREKLFRYRSLTAGNERELDMSHNRSLLGYASAQAGAVHNVHASESSASHAEILEMLRTGEVVPSDLVFSDGRWVTFSESPDFYEHCEGVSDWKQNAMKRRSLLAGLGAIALFVLYAVLRSLARSY